MTTQPQTVPIARIIENTIIINGSIYKSNLHWTDNPTLAPAKWLEVRTQLRRGLPPGCYDEVGRIIDAATGDTIESYHQQWVCPAAPITTPTKEEDPVESDLAAWQKFSLALSATPGILAGLTCLPALLVMYLSYKITGKLISIFEFWQALNTPDKP